MKKIFLSVLFISSILVTNAQQNTDTSKDSKKSTQQSTQKSDDENLDLIDGLENEKVLKTPEERATKQIAKMTEKLSLTTDQQTQVKAVLLERATKIDALKTKYAGNKKAGREEWKQVRMDSQTKIKAILTPEQSQKMDEIKKELKNNHQKNGRKKMSNNNQLK